jgi:hypothetical protein
MKHRPDICSQQARANRGSVIAAAAGAGLLSLGAVGQEQPAEDTLRQGQEQLQEAQQGQQETDVALLDQAFVEETEEVRATVMEIEPESRTVALRTDDGEEFIVQAAEDLDLTNVGVGDSVDVAYYQALAAEITTAPAGQSPVVMATKEARVGEPGGAVGLVYTAIVTIDEVDTETNTVMFTNPEGEPREVVVERPEFQAFLTRLSEGDTVQVTYGGALAVSLTPAE